MPKLCQIIALANGKKARSQAGLTELYHLIQKTPLLDGITRTYRPLDENGEKFPPEAKKVQTRVTDLIVRVRGILTDMIDIVVTQDTANTQAFADIVVDDTVLAEHVPVCHLLFLEKHLVDLATFVEKLPILDPAESWERNDEMDCYATAPFETIKTKKLPRNHVKYEATKDHPAQVEMYTEDVLVGNWTTIKFSGAILEADRRAIIARIRQLQDAVKTAREEANCLEVKDVSIAENLLDFVFDTP